MNRAAKLALFFAFLFTFWSACLSGKFGWDHGQGDQFEQVIYSGLFITISAGVGFVCWVASGLLGLRKWFIGAIASIFAVFFIVADLASGFGQASNTSEGSALVSRNSMGANDKREKQIVSLKRRIRRAETKPLWSADLRTADAYRAHKSQLENQLVTGKKRNLFQRSKGCTDVTTEESKSLCFEWNAAKEGIANAEEKARLEADVARWEADVARLSQEVINKPTTLSASLSRSIVFARLWLGKLEPGEEAATWADMGFSGYIGFMATFGAIIFSMAAGWLGVRPDYSALNNAGAHVPVELTDERSARSKPARGDHYELSESEPGVTIINSSASTSVTASEQLKRALALAEKSLSEHNRRSPVTP